MASVQTFDRSILQRDRRPVIENAMDGFLSAFLASDSDQFTEVFKMLDATDTTARLDLNSSLAAYHAFIDFKDFISDGPFVSSVITILDNVCDDPDMDSDERLAIAREDIDATLTDKLVEFVYLERDQCSCDQVDCLLENEESLLHALTTLRELLIDMATDAILMTEPYQSGFHFIPDTDSYDTCFIPDTIAADIPPAVSEWLFPNASSGAVSIVG